MIQQFTGNSAAAKSIRAAYRRQAGSGIEARVAVRLSMLPGRSAGSEKQVQRADSVPACHSDGVAPWSNMTAGLVESGRISGTFIQTVFKPVYLQAGTAVNGRYQ